MIDQILNDGVSKVLQQFSKTKKLNSFIVATKPDGSDVVVPLDFGDITLKIGLEIVLGASEKTDPKLFKTEPKLFIVSTSKNGEKMAIIAARSGGKQAICVLSQVPMSKKGKAKLVLLTDATIKEDWFLFAIPTNWAGETLSVTIP